MCVIKNCITLLYEGSKKCGDVVAAAAGFGGLVVDTLIMSLCFCVCMCVWWWCMVSTRGEAPFIYMPLIYGAQVEKGGRERGKEVIAQDLSAWCFPLLLFILASPSCLVDLCVSVCAHATHTCI
jgi:hypothetical protein